MVNTSDHSSIEINDLETCMTEELRKLCRITNECCIYRVPQIWRELNESVHTPKVVSIGPFHHGREGLKAMEEFKRRYFHDFLQRTEVRMKGFLKLIKDSEPRLRSSYAVSIELKSDDFVKMVLVDAAFLIEFLLRYHEPQFIDDTMLTNKWTDKMLIYTWMDILLVENQLPMFILEDVLNLAGIYEDLSVVKLAGNFWSQIYPFLNLEQQDRHPFEAAHFLDLLSHFFQPPNRSHSASVVKYHSYKAAHFLDLLCHCFRKPHRSHPPEKFRFFSLTTPSVKELHEVGIKFKSGSSKNLFDITFNEGVLEIPKLAMNIHTENVLRNLEVYEQLHYIDRNYVNDYIVMMNYLVNSPKDVQILVENEVIDNGLMDSERVSAVFNKLYECCTGTDDFYYSYLVEELNRYYRTPCNRWKATLRQKYFNTPWAIISVIAALIALVLTFIQTVCSVIKP